MFSKLIRVAVYMFTFGVVPVSAPQGTYGKDYEEYKQVAGHRILKILYEAGYHNRNGLRIGIPRVIFQDRAGHYWVGSILGLFKYSEVRNEWAEINNGQEPGSIQGVISIGQDNAGKIWIRSGIEFDARCFDGKTWHNANELHPPRRIKNIQTMFTGKDGRLWFVLNDALVAYNGFRWEAIYMMPEAIKESSVSFGLQDQNGDIWLATRKTIVRFHENPQKWEIDAFPRELLRADYIYKDRKGRIWIGDEYGHISVKSKSVWTSYSITDRVPLQSSKVKINAIYQDNLNQMMFATDEGLIVFNESDGKWKLWSSEYNKFPDNIVSAILEDNMGRIWIGTGKGILVLEQ